MTRQCITSTDPRFADLDQVIGKYRPIRGGLIPVLHEAQQIFGYLPEEVLDRIAAGLELAASEVYGVVTFYNLFSTTPVGRHKVNVCLGTACYVQGAGKVLDELKAQLGIDPGQVTPDGEFSLEVARCVGACSLAPAVVVDGEVHARMMPEQVKGLLAQVRQSAPAEAEPETAGTAATIPARVEVSTS